MRGCVRLSGIEKKRMAERAKPIDFELTLKPFYQRASEAEVKLTSHFLIVSLSFHFLLLLLLLKTCHSSIYLPLEICDLVVSFVFSFYIEASKRVFVGYAEFNCLIEI